MNGVCRILREIEYERVKMSKTIPFFDLFSDYIPERELRILLLEVLIEEAVIDKETLTMSVKLLSSQPLPEGALEKVQEQMRQLYRLKSVELSVRVCAPEPVKKKKTETYQKIKAQHFFNSCCVCFCRICCCGVYQSADSNQWQKRRIGFYDTRAASTKHEKQRD